MKNVFSYDSKLMIMLNSLANTMFLNLLFLLCCIPVFTVGAATTALFRGCRAIAEDEPCYRAYFHAFKTSFRRATLAWLIWLAGMLVFIWCAWVIWVNKLGGYRPALIVSALVLVFLMVVSNMTFLFYSRFECTLKQLLKNGLYMTLGHLFRAIFMGLAMWLPVLFFFLLPDVFVALSVAWVLIYFATIGNISVRMMKTPFARLAEAAGCPIPEVNNDPIPDEMGGLDGEDGTDDPAALDQ